MRHLADTNILTRSLAEAKSGSQTLLESLDRLSAAGDAIYLAPQNLIEFWRVCTRSLQQNGLGLLPATADREVAKLEAIFRLLPEVPEIYNRWRVLVVAHSVSGAQVHDARLVATMLVYGIESILTFNGRDFQRYRQHIRITDPGTI